MRLEQSDLYEMFVNGTVDGKPYQEEVIVAKKQKRHVTAKAKVEVFRLFKARDLAHAVAQSADPVVATLGSQMFTECNTMLKPYMDLQNRLANPAEWKEQQELKRKKTAHYRKLMGDTIKVRLPKRYSK